MIHLPERRAVEFARYLKQKSIIHIRFYTSRCRLRREALTKHKRGKNDCPFVLVIQIQKGAV